MNLKGTEIFREALRGINRRAGVLKSDPYGIGLSLTQGSALVDIGRYGPLKPNDLVRLLHLEKSSVSRLLKGLENNGYISVGDDDGDARSKVISLTRSGQKAVETIDRQSNALVSEILGCLENEEQKAVVAAFKKLIAATP
jgi:putative acetyltransferase